MADFLSDEWIEALQNLGSKLPKIQAVSVSCQYEISGTPDGKIRYYIVWKDGRVSEASKGKIDHPECRFTAKYEDAIEHFKIASELDAKLTGKCYSAISEIYFNNQEIDKALEFINQALDKTTDADIVLDLQINKAQYLRKNGQVEEALTIFESLSEESINVVAKNELFLIHMDNDDCKKSIEIGEPLFITMEEDPNVSMAKLSELAFNIAACFNQQADKSYNEIIEYLGAEEKNNELTELNLERSETVKDLYSSAKDYYRLSLDYDEDSSTTTKEYKKKMRKDIRKVDEQIIPALEGLLE